jgi:putative ABC transport system permease protein
MIAIALVLGLGGASALARVLSSRLFGVTPFDPLVWTLSAATLVGLAAVASWLPARRAVSVDVTSSLRAL